MRKKTKNRYVWRLDFSLLDKNHDGSEIGREIKKHTGLYKAVLLIGVICACIVFLTPVVLFIYHADLTYIIISGMVALFTSFIYGKIFFTPKISKSVLESIEDEIHVNSESMKEFDAIFTEDALIVFQGIMVYRIPYHEISGIRVRRYRYNAGGTKVWYKLCDGSRIETVYYGVRTKSHFFDVFWEQLLKYNPDIRIDDPLRHSKVF